MSKPSSRSPLSFVVIGAIIIVLALFVFGKSPETAGSDHGGESIINEGALNNAIDNIAESAADAAEATQEAVEDGAEAVQKSAEDAVDATEKALKN